MKGHWYDKTRCNIKPLIHEYECLCLHLISITSHERRMPWLRLPPKNQIQPHACSSPVMNVLSTTYATPASLHNETNLHQLCACSSTPPLLRAHRYKNYVLFGHVHLIKLCSRIYHSLWHETSTHLFSQPQPHICNLTRSSSAILHHDRRKGNINNSSVPWPWPCVHIDRIFTLYL